MGIGTALADNPRLTTRLPQGGKNPVRIVLDSKLRLPIRSHLADTSEAETWIFTTTQKDQRRELELTKQGVHIITCNSMKIEWEEVFKTLGKENILSVLVEGGKSNQCLSFAK